MKTIAHLGSIEQAQLLKMKLGSMEIEAIIPDEISAGVAPHLFMTKQGIRVQVADEDEAEALRIIKEAADSEAGEIPES